MQRLTLMAAALVAAFAGLVGLAGLLAPELASAKAGPDPDGLRPTAAPSAVLARAGNPLALSTAPPASDPLRGAHAFVDREGGLAAVAARRLRHSHPRQARLLHVIAREPDTGRWGNWTAASDVGPQVSAYLARAAAESPGSVPELSTYWIVDPTVDPPELRPLLRYAGA